MLISFMIVKSLVRHKARPGTPSYVAWSAFSATFLRSFEFHVSPAVDLGLFKCHYEGKGVFSNLPIRGLSGRVAS